MATVVNRANPGGFLDKTLDNYNRSNAGEPNSSLTPQFVGEIVLDTTNNALWRAVNLTTTGWVALTAPN